VEQPAGRSDKPETGLLAKLLSGQIRLAGARCGAVRGPQHCDFLSDVVDPDDTLHPPFLE
jgi:hypothetical protein